MIQAVVSTEETKVATWRIVFVHGTWGRGFWRPTPLNPKAPRWFEPESPFSRELFKCLTAIGIHFTEPEQLLWSGANALRDRGEAAQRLAEALKERPGDPCLIVAHSHGGNVVLRALDELNEQTMSRLHVVTLATPFVELFLSNRGRYNFERVQLAVFVLLLTGAVASYMQMFTPWSALWAYLPGAVALWLAIDAVRQEKDDFTAGRLTLATELEWVANYNKFKIRAPRTLILRGIEDEASLAIAAASCAGRFLQLSRDVVNRAWHAKLWAAGLALAVFVGSLAVIFGYLHLYGEEALSASGLLDKVHRFGWISSYIIVLPPIFITGAAVIARMVSGIAAGRELFRLPHLEVSVNSVPDLNTQLGFYTDVCRVLTLPRQGEPVKHIRHQLYDDIGTVPAIGNWLLGLRRMETNRIDTNRI